jgi:hypothetical protein
MQREPPAPPMEIGARRWPASPYGKAIAALFRFNFAECFVVEILHTLLPHCGDHRATSQASARRAARIARQQRRQAKQDESRADKLDHSHFSSLNRARP